MADQVGFIGLGKMGRPMAEHLLAAGFPLHVFNRSRGPVDALVAKGAKPAPSARDVAARAEIVLTALPTPESVDAVYAELSAAARPGQLFVDHSTIGIQQSRRLGETLRGRGAAFLDAPISGGPAGAQAGTLTVMAGGERTAFDRALPILRAFGKSIHLCGPAGAGQVVKLVNQLLVGIHTAASAEAAVFGAKLGADPKILLEVIGTSFGGSAMLQRNLPRFISRDFTPASPVGLIAKDLGLIHDEAKRSGATLLLGSLAEQRFLESGARGFAELDMAAVIQLWEEAAGIVVSKR
jgi:3-hydroxyisobutyrate dehydrogenase/2-hydroxy-3-oxopropionate reductase